jgi:uncharacterized protein with PIN domain
MKPANEEKACPQCGGTLQKGQAIALLSMMAAKAYLCKACKTLYYHDLKPLARVMS